MKYVILDNYLGDNYTAGQVVEFDDLPKHLIHNVLPVKDPKPKELEVSTPDQKQVLKDKIKAAGGEVPKGNASEETLKKALDAALAKSE